jgi:hypothetical protein
MTDWQPIETAPRDGTEILALEVDVDRLSYAVVTWEQGEGGPGLEFGEWRDMGDIGAAGMYEFEPQWWMPLPEPPGE